MEIQQRDGCKLLFDIYKNGKWSDLTIINEGKAYHVHKVVLCNRSSYFDKMVSLQPINNIIQLDFTTNLFDLIIEWAYNGKILITKGNAVELFRIADQMQMNGLTEKILNFLWNSFSDCALENIDLWMNKILKKTKNMENSGSSYSFFIDRYIRSNFCDIIYADSFLDYDENTVSYMIGLNELNIENEMEIFEAIIRWVQRNVKQRSSHLSKLLKKVRWTDINAVSFMSRIDTLPWIMKCDQARHVIMAAVELMFYKSVEQMQVYDVNLKPRSRSSNSIYCISSSGMTDEIITLENIGKSENRGISLVKNPNLPAAEFTDYHLTEHSVNCDTIIRIDWKNKTYRMFKETGSFYNNLFGRMFKFSNIDKKVHLFKGNRSIEFAPFYDIGFPIKAVTKGKGQFYLTTIIDVIPVPLYKPKYSHNDETKQNLEPIFKCLDVKILDEKEQTWHKIATRKMLTEEKIKVLKITIFHDLLVILTDHSPLLIYNLNSQTFEEYTNYEISLNELSDLHFVHDNSNLLIYHRAQSKKSYKKLTFEVCDGKLTLISQLDGLRPKEDILGFITLDEQYFCN